MAQRQRLDTGGWIQPRHVDQMSLLDILQDEDAQPTRQPETILDRLEALESEYDATLLAEPSPPAQKKPSKSPASTLGGRVVDVPFHAPTRTPTVPDIISLVDETLSEFSDATEKHNALVYLLSAPNNHSCLSEPGWRTTERKALRVFEEHTRCWVNTRGRAQEWERLLQDVTLNRVYCAEGRESAPLTCAFGAYRVWTYQVDDALYVYCVLRPVGLDFVYLGHLCAQSVQSHELDIESSMSSSSSDSTASGSPLSPPVS